MSLAGLRRPPHHPLLRFPRNRCLNLYFRRPFLPHTNLLPGGTGEIDLPPFDIRPAIINGDLYRFARFEVSNDRLGTQGQRRMRRGQLLLIERVATGGLFPLLVWPVPRSRADLFDLLAFRGWAPPPWSVRVLAVAVRV